MAEDKRHDKVMVIQAERLSKELGIEPGSFFTSKELEQLTTTEANKEIEFRGKKVKITMSAKATAGILLTKVRRGH